MQHVQLQSNAVESFEKWTFSDDSSRFTIKFRDLFRSFIKTVTDNEFQEFFASRELHNGDYVTFAKHNSSRIIRPRILSLPIPQ